MDTLRRRKSSRSIGKKIISVILFLVLLLLMNATWKMYRSYKESVERKETVSDEFGEIEGRIQAVETKVASLQTIEGREAEIRSSFNVVKPGEQVAIVVPTEETVQKKVEKRPWYTWLWRGNLIGVEN
ncbi:MAG: hypothetical protein COV34_01115 [Candidatus Zambryskibacteria bacterium CG10_big_fil_rev_8_21_14_0_10_42_12]|uniref:Uncharacterized protein n=1 Tax=Candidatus Zambryskibacteria bacterium CG10_big_fil_rev_8_21_14_0_10_42_12 TaxID=1975115 RepID=A0A2H0QVB0_9BACT|nr:MAG: hypothetical protein COV34_01115 [Candidatus Zambryskibacteria bacterium CG10_big_fil_rev_8_21_14_0_10_42_12]